MATGLQRMASEQSRVSESSRFLMVVVWEQHVSLAAPQPAEAQLPRLKARRLPQDFALPSGADGPIIQSS